MTSYIVTIEIDHHRTCIEMRPNKRKRQVLMFYPQGKTQKNLRGGWQPPPPFCVQGLISM